MFLVKFVWYASEDGMGLELDLNDSDDKISFLYELCDTLSSLDNSDFVVSGFGQDNWPVDVETDLPILLEQLGEIGSFLKNEKQELKISFYEQGIERDLLFKNEGQNVRISCQSFGSWEPQFTDETMQIDEFKLMLETFINNFDSCLERCLPNFHPKWLIYKDKELGSKRG